MANITLSIDDDLVRKVRKIALDRDTTLTAMVREYLESVAQAASVERLAAAARLRESWERHSSNHGPRTWTRDELYDR